MIMSKSSVYIAALVLSSGLFVGCSMGADHSDLSKYIAETKARPAGAIEPLPAFRPFEAFIYSSAAIRSPFERPVEVTRRLYTKSGEGVKPDFNRTKEILESFDFAVLKMVGTLEKGGVLWALLSDDVGAVHWVRSGNFLGKNHGKVIETTENKIEIIEIISDGLDGWVERPRVIPLTEEKD